MNKVLRNIKFLMEKEDLWQYVQSVDLVKEDRIYVHLDTSIYLDLHMKCVKKTWKQIYPVNKAHAELGKFYFGGNRRDSIGIMDGYESFRQLSRPSLQITMMGEEVGNLVGDIDIDLGNPIYDILSGLIHLAEVLRPGKTDHNKLYQKLKKRYPDL